jgi:hypothetical protein
MPKSIALAFGVLVLVALVAPLYVTRHSIGLSGDSFAYVSAARSYIEQGQMRVLNGQGSSDILWNWPPLYPSVLASLIPVLGDAMTAARWLDIILFPINMLLLIGVARRLGIAPGWTAFIGVLFAFAPSIMNAHVWAMSDALFVTCWLAGWFLVLQYKTRQSWALLTAAGVAAGLALLDRYMGLATATAFGLYILLCTSGGWGRKLLATAAYMTLAIAPLAIWMFIGSHMWALVKPRVQEMPHGSTLHSWLGPISSTIGRWIVPVDGYGPVKIAAFLVVVAAGVAWTVVFLRAGGAKDFRLGPVLAGERAEITVLLNMAGAEAILVLNKIFRLHDFVITERDSIPVFVSLLFLIGLVGTAAQPVFADPARRAWRNAFGALAGLVLAGYVFGGLLWIWRGDDVHLDWASRTWRESPAHAYLAQLPASTPIYGNLLEPIYFYTGRNSLYSMPDKDWEINGQRNPQYALQLADILTAIVQQHAVLVIFNVDSTQRYVTSDEVKKLPQFQVVLDTPNVTIFKPN